MQDDLLLGRIRHILIKDYAAHTIVLYGSRADGSAALDSDYDIAAFAPCNALKRDTRTIEGAALDAFIYPDTALETAQEDYLRLRGGRILRQRGKQAERFLTNLDALFLAGPPALPADEIAARKTWARKMLVRLRRDDVEGHYRRAWLLMALLEDYFHVRGLWYEGPKKSFQWLKVNAPAAHDAFGHALTPAASHADIERLVEIVTED